MIRTLPKALLVAAAAWLCVGPASAQDSERALMRVEAEIISGLSGTVPPGSIGSSTSLGGTPSIGGVAPTPQQDDDGSGEPGDQNTPGDPAAPQQPAMQQRVSQPSASVEDVAAGLVTSAQTGSLTAADTALVSALRAGTRTQRQNLESLISVTVIDESGNIQTTTMRSSDLRPDLLGPSIGLSTLDAATVGGSTAQRLFQGDVMRRSAGVTYFYVQVCSCAL